MVECQLPKLEVAGSSPVIRSQEYGHLCGCFSFGGIDEIFFRIALPLVFCSRIRGCVAVISVIGSSHGSRGDSETADRRQVKSK